MTSEAGQIINRKGCIRVTIEGSQGVKGVQGINSIRSHQVRLGVEAPGSAIFRPEQLLGEQGDSKPGHFDGREPYQAKEKVA